MAFLCQLMFTIYLCSQIPFNHLVSPRNRTGAQTWSASSLLCKRFVMCWLENFCLFFQQWYNSSMNVICTWLTDRMDLQLHIYQLKTLIRMVKVKEKIIILLCKQLTEIPFIVQLQKLLNTKDIGLHIKQDDF